MNHLKFRIPAVAVVVMIALVPMLWRTASAEQTGITRVNWDNLNLSEDQREQLDSMDQQWKNTVHELAPRIENNRRKLKLMMNESQPDENEIMELQQQVHEDQLKLKMRATKLYLGKKKVLNADQQEKFSQMMNHSSDTVRYSAPAGARLRH
jgi:Spy/CpxP family protein refolding chaperone